MLDRSIKKIQNIVREHLYSINNYGDDISSSSDRNFVITWSIDYNRFANKDLSQMETRQNRAKQGEQVRRPARRSGC